MSLQNKIILNNTVEIPHIGLGVWKMPEGKETVSAICTALEAGYRLIDTAKYYGNEASVGQAVRQFVGTGAAKREDIFVTTKLWPADFLQPEKACMRSLRELDLEYIDVYLIHWPSPIMPKKIWQTLEKMYEQKLVRAIGISNYGERDIEKVLAYATIPPSVNQIKFSIFDHDLELVEYCTSKNIVVEAYSPLERGHVDHPIIATVASAHNKTSPQIMIRWCLERGTIPLPKSSNSNRIKKNIDVFDFKLTKEEMSRLDSLG